MDNNREKVRAAHKKYKTGLKIVEPSFLGSMLLTCERDDMSIMDILSEFEITPINDYFAKCRAHRKLPGVIEEV